MRRPGWARLTAGLFVLWFALAGAGGLPGCPMGMPASGGEGMAGMPAMPGSTGVPGGSMAAERGARAGVADIPARVARGAPAAPGAQATPAAPGGSSARSHQRPGGDATGHARAVSCACPSACSGRGAWLPAADRVALAGSSRWLRAQAAPRATFVAPRLLSHFLPYPSGPPSTV